MQNVDVHQTQVPPLFRDPKHLKHLRPLRSVQEDPREVTPVKPRLLQRLEVRFAPLRGSSAASNIEGLPSCATSFREVIPVGCLKGLPHERRVLQALLGKKLESAQERATTHGPIRSQWAVATLRLDAYRQVFETLINSMTTYKPVLQRIRNQYDTALDEALKTTYEHIHMRAEIAIADSKQARAVDDALVESADKALKLRDQLLKQLAATEAKALAAEAAADDEEAAAKDALLQLVLLDRKAKELQHDNQRLLLGMQERSSWNHMKSLPSGATCDLQECEKATRVSPVRRDGGDHHAE